MKTILIVDDEPQIAEIAGDYLGAGGFDVITAADGVRALELVRGRRPDLVVLDLGLPGMDGTDVARAIRRDSDLPIIILTARVQEDDRLHGLEIGADDYVAKPFSPRELVARVRAVLRRLRPESGDVFRIDDLIIDVPRMRVARGERAIDLTPAEFQIVATMARHAGRVFTRSQLLETIATESFDRAIDSHVKNIRKKLGARYVQSVYGIGYKFVDT